jgi:hypothetical protein
MKGDESLRQHDCRSGQAGLRLILPFIDHWWWWGGREQLAAFIMKNRKIFTVPTVKPLKPIWM